MEKVIFINREGPKYSDKFTSFVFCLEHLSGSKIQEIIIKVSFSKTLVLLYNVDENDSELYFNCLLKELYRNGLKNFINGNSELKIGIDENQHLFDPEHNIKFAPKYIIDL